MRIQSHIFANRNFIRQSVESRITSRRLFHPEFWGSNQGRIES